MDACLKFLLLFTALLLQLVVMVSTVYSLSCEFLLYFMKLYYYCGKIFNWLAYTHGLWLILMQSNWQALVFYSTQFFKIFLWLDQRNWNWFDWSETTMGEATHHLFNSTYNWALNPFLNIFHVIFTIFFTIGV